MANLDAYLNELLRKASVKDRTIQIHFENGRPRFNVVSHGQSFGSFQEALDYVQRAGISETHSFAGGDNVNASAVFRDLNKKFRDNNLPYQIENVSYNFDKGRVGDHQQILQEVYGFGDPSKEPEALLGPIGEGKAKVLRIYNKETQRYLVESEIVQLVKSHTGIDIATGLMTGDGWLSRKKLDKRLNAVFSAKSTNLAMDPIKISVTRNIHQRNTMFQHKLRDVGDVNKLARTPEGRADLIRYLWDEDERSAASGLSQSEFLKRARSLYRQKTNDMAQDGLSFIDERYVGTLVDEQGKYVKALEKQLSVLEASGDRIGASNIKSHLKEARANVENLRKLQRGEMVSNIRVLNVAGLVNLDGKALQGDIDKLMRMTFQLKGNVMVTRLSKKEYEQGVRIRAHIDSFGAGGSGTVLTSQQIASGAKSYFTLDKQESALGKRVRFDVESYTAFRHVYTDDVLGGLVDSHLAKMKSEVEALMERGEIGGTIRRIIEDQAEDLQNNPEVRARARAVLEAMDNLPGGQNILKNMPGLKKEILGIVISGGTRKGVANIAMPAASRGYILTDEMIRTSLRASKDREHINAISRRMDTMGKNELATVNGQMIIRAQDVHRFYNRLGGFDFDDSMNIHLRVQDGKLKAFGHRLPTAFDEWVMFDIKTTDDMVIHHAKLNIQRLYQKASTAEEIKHAESLMKEISREQGESRRARDRRIGKRLQDRQFLESVFEEIDDSIARRAASEEVVAAAVEKTDAYKRELNELKKMVGEEGSAYYDQVERVKLARKNEFFTYMKHGMGMGETHTKDMLTMGSRYSQLAGSIEAQGTLGKYVNARMFLDSFINENYDTIFNKQEYIEKIYNTILRPSEDIIDALTQGSPEQVAAMSGNIDAEARRMMQVVLEIARDAKRAGINFNGIDEGLLSLKFDRIGVTNELRDYFSEIAPDQDFEDLLYKGTGLRRVIDAGEIISDMGKDEVFDFGKELYGFREFESVVQARRDARVLGAIIKDQYADGAQRIASEMIGANLEDFSSFGQIPFGSTRLGQRIGMSQWLIENTYDESGNATRRTMEALIALVQNHGADINAQTLLGGQGSSAAFMGILTQMTEATDFDNVSRELLDMLSVGNLQKELGTVFSSSNILNVLEEAGMDAKQIAELRIGHMAFSERSVQLTEEGLQAWGQQEGARVMSLGQRVGSFLDPQTMIDMQLEEGNVPRSVGSIVEEIQRQNAIWQLRAPFQAPTSEMVAAQKRARELSGHLVRAAENYVGMQRSTMVHETVNANFANSLARRLGMDEPKAEAAKFVQRMAEKVADSRYHDSGLLKATEGFAQLWDDKMARRSMQGMAAFLAAGIINMVVKRDRTVDDMRGPAQMNNAPTPYSGERQSVSYDPTYSQPQQGNGTTYVVRTTGGRAPANNLLDEIFGVTQADITLRSDSPQFQGDYAKEQIMSRFR